MACKKCGSDWTTKEGSDCKTCPDCCKQQRHTAKKEGRWVEPTQQKTCEECGIEFTAVGLHNIAIQVLCGSSACKAARHKRKRQASAKRRAAGVYTLSREPKPERHCQFSGCGKKLTRRDQKDYCGKPCYFAAIDAGEQQFKGRVQDDWARLADWAYEWEAQRPAFVKCMACGKQIAQCNGRRKFCDDKCAYRYQFPLPTHCCDCDCEINAKDRKQTRCVACKRKRLKEFRRNAKRLLGNYRRRCRYYGVPYDKQVTRRKVFERDNYICQLCGVRCLGVFTLIDGIPDPLSPTVDHIIAISKRIKGHTWDNVQCACWSCNVAKGARAKGQLRLAMV